MQDVQQAPKVMPYSKGTFEYGIIMDRVYQE